MMFVSQRAAPAPVDRSVFVEIRIRTSMETLWAHTQTPSLHERWDLRFSRIEYLPKVQGAESQRFRYRTRIGCGLEVSGIGDTVGHRQLTDGSRASSLRFGSNARVSIIRDGSGYWKYIPTADGVRFVTRYDYHTRFGPIGAIVDRLVFRPLLGWATAWSFDRLRLWLEHGVDPAHALRRTLRHAIVRRSCADVPSAVRCLRRPAGETI